MIFLNLENYDIHPYITIEYHEVRSSVYELFPLSILIILVKYIISFCKYCLAVSLYIISKYIKGLTHNLKSNLNAV